MDPRDMDTIHNAALVMDGSMWADKMLKAWK
jgi:hypothetical protein